MIFLWILQVIPKALGYSYLPEDDTGTGSMRFYENSGHGQRYMIKMVDRPFHALVFYGTLYCSGALINSRLVVTAASCFLKRDQEPCMVKMGADFIQGSGQVINVLEVKIHEFFGHLSEIDNDIAMLVLEKHVDFLSGVKKVLIVEPDVALRIGTAIDASGWASQEVAQQYVAKMIITQMRVLDPIKCRAAHSIFITNSNYCASYVAERRLTDNGGPAMFKELLIGIVSYAAQYKEPPNVAILTNVSYFHRWIALNTDNLLRKYCSRGSDTE